MHAYDIELLKHSITSDGPRGQGWCFGLPPGISPDQWPLDPNNGYPLSHGFTILLPEDYRVHGPDLVALSFFATPCDKNDGGPETIGEIAAVSANVANGPRPADPDLAIFWDAETNRHPHMHRMKDLLDADYAVILLTQKEFDAPFCPPPRLAPNRHRDRTSPPVFLTIGAAAAFWDGKPSPRIPVEEMGYFKMFGGIPEKDPAYNRALSWIPRRSDPNAGIPPREDYHVDRGGYQSHYYWENDVIQRENYRLHDWAKDHKSDHIGGTMRPCQGIPDITPYYIEFEEYLGGYNFGGGNGWLDFKDMKFDWSQ